jgi:homopolymeric O-antigen transport system permease protein
MTNTDDLNLFRHLGILARNRELLFRMMHREVSSRYRQTFLGIAWAFIKPAATVAIFTFVFSGLAKIPSDRVPYPLFLMAGLLPWSLFSAAVGSGTSSLTGQSNLVAKIYFPREILPFASVAASALDSFIALLFLIGLMVHFGVGPTWNVLYAVPVLMIETLLILGVTLFFSLANVWYRDIAHAAGLLLQLWMYLTPVLYPMDLVRGTARSLMALNPMAGIVEGFRSAMIMGAPPEPGLLAWSFGTSLCVFLAGYAVFKRSEFRLADVI